MSLFVDNPVLNEQRLSDWPSHEAHLSQYHQIRSCHCSRTDTDTSRSNTLHAITG